MFEEFEEPTSAAVWAVDVREVPGVMGLAVLGWAGARLFGPDVGLP